MRCRCEKCSTIPLQTFSTFYSEILLQFARKLICEFFWPFLWETPHYRLWKLKWHFFGNFFGSLSEISLENYSTNVSAHLLKNIDYSFGNSLDYISRS